MWGDVTPAERLRSVTRRRVDDDRLAAEAAEALAGFASEPASLVVACRRVLAHHRMHAPLWWVCARILAAAEPAAAAHTAADLLERDQTGQKLGAALPLLDENEVIAALGWPAAVDDALVERFDLDAVAVRIDGSDPTYALRHRRSDHAVRVVEAWDPTLEHVARLLVPALAVGPDRVIVPLGTIDAVATIAAAAAEIWLVGGVGRVLPGRLFDVLAAQCDLDTAEADLGTAETMSLERFDRLVGPRGAERPADAAARSDCPVVPELLRPL
jgi:hypothetical protein